MILKLVSELSIFLYKKIFDRNHLLILIFILGFGLRIIGTNPGYLNHPDEPKIVDAALNITFKLDFEPIAFYYGSLLPIIYALINFLFVLPIYIIFYIPLNFILSILQDNPTIAECILKNGFSSCALSESKEFFSYLIRNETAFLASISIILIYYLGKKLFNKKVGLLSAFFTAINYRHVLSSHFALADAPVTVFIILSILLSLNLLKSKSTKNYLFAGIGIGLVLSVKYFFYTLITFFLCHILSSLQEKNLNQMWKSLINSKIFISLFVSAILFSIINIYLFLDYKNAKEQFELNAMLYQTSNLSLQSLWQFSKIPSFSLFYLFEYGLGRLISIAAILGFIISIFKYPKSTIILSTVIIPFLYFFLVISATTYVRNYSAILPLLVIFAGVFIDYTTNSVLNRYFKSISLLSLIPVIIILTLIYDPFKKSWIVSYSFAQTPNYKLLEDWILINTSKDSKIVKSWGTPFPGNRQISSEWTPYSTGYQSLSELIENGVEWLIISSRSGVYINHSLNVSDRNDIITPSFINPEVFWSFLENNYASLLTRELAGYRIKEFTKPLGSLDPSFVIIKIPSFDESSLEPTSFLPLDNYPLINSECFVLSSDRQLNSELKITSSNQTLHGLRPSQVILGKIPIKENRLFKVSGELILDSNADINSYKEAQNFRSRFLRIDYYNNKNQIIKSVVSSQLREIKSWGKLISLSISPKGASYTTVSLQIDECRKDKNDIYIFKNIQIFESTNTQRINLSVYPFYNQELSRDFIWQPPL